MTAMRDFFSSEKLFCCSFCNFFDVYLYYMDIMGNKKMCGANLKKDLLNVVTSPLR